MARGLSTITGSPGIYNGGAVVFNAQPALNYYAQMLQHKQAKDEALGKYYQDLGKNINGAGMRTQDISGGWNNKVNDWQKFYNDHADEIKYPRKYGADAQNEFYSRYRDIMNDIDRSKEAGKNESMVREKMLDPKWREETTDQDMVIANNMGRSIYDPQHYKDGHTTPFGAEDFSFNAPPFDVNKQKATLDLITHGLPRGETPHPSQQPTIDKAARTVTTPMVAGYDDQTYNSIIERGVQIMKADKSVQKYVENELHNPEDLAKLNPVFKQKYGKDIASPDDVMRAWTIQNIPKQIAGKDKVREWTDPNASLQRQEDYYDYREGKKQEALAKDDSGVENFMQTMESEGKKAGVMKYKTADGKTFDTYDIKLTPALKKIFTIRVGPHLSEPDAVRVNAETGDYMPLHYAKKDGVPIKENGQYAINPAQPTQAVSREAVKASLATVLPKRAVKQLQGAPAPAGDAGAAAKADELLKKYLQQ